MQKKLIFKCTKSDIYKKTKNYTPYNSYIKVYSSNVYINVPNRIVNPYIPQMK